MKLTNKQLDIVKDMIREKVKASTEAKRKAEDKALKEKAIKLCEKHPAFIAFVKVLKELPSKYFYEIAIKDWTFFNIAWQTDDSYGQHSHTHIKSKEEFYDAVTRKLPGFKYNRNEEYDTKKDIERKLVMASVAAKDIESLIDSISKEFVK